MLKVETGREDGGCWLAERLEHGESVPDLKGLFAV